MLILFQIPWVTWKKMWSLVKAQLQLFVGTAGRAFESVIFSWRQRMLSVLAPNSHWISTRLRKQPSLGLQWKSLAWYLVWAAVSLAGKRLILRSLEIPFPETAGNLSAETPAILLLQYKFLPTKKFSRLLGLLNTINLPKSKSQTKQIFYMCEDTILLLFR